MHRNRTRSHAARARHGFTLVELLVVIGIIALLVGILLPTLNRAKESGRRVQCLSNLKQIAGATLMYCSDNGGAFPGRAGQGADSIVQDTRADTYYGWIAWRRARDPITGRNYSGENGTGFNQNITHSALTRYLGAKQVLHATPEEANTVNPALESVFRCPSDNLSYRPQGLNGGRGEYRYSFSMNIMFGNKAFDPAALGTTAALIAHPHRKMNQVKNPTDKILFMDESELTINNGENNPTVTPDRVDNFTQDYSAIAERHELKSKRNSQDARGNVAFADGHAEFFTRKDAFLRKHFDPDYGR